jgi:septal ring factor EnvC (AmiA/AmiB activator)
MVLNLVAVVFLFTCGIVVGNGQSTIGENELFDFKQKMAAMEENMAKQKFRISSLENQLKIQDIEIKDLKDKVMTFGPKIQDVEESVTSLKRIIMRIKPNEPENKRCHFLFEIKYLIFSYCRLTIAKHYATGK